MRPLIRVSGALLAAPLMVLLVPDRMHGQIFRSGIELVQVTAVVRDGGGRLVGDLDPEDFEIFEDGVP